MFGRFFKKEKRDEKSEEEVVNRLKGIATVDQILANIKTCNDIEYIKKIRTESLIFRPKSPTEMDLDKIYLAAGQRLIELAAPESEMEEKALKRMENVRKIFRERS